MITLKRTIERELAFGEHVHGFSDLKDSILRNNQGQKFQVDNEEKLNDVQKKVQDWVPTIEGVRYIGISSEYVEVRYSGTPWLIPLSEFHIEFISPFKEKNTENERKRIVRNVKTFIKYNHYPLSKIAGFLGVCEHEVEEQLTHTNENVDELSAQIASAIGFDVRKFVFPSFQVTESASVVSDMIRRKATDETIKELENHPDIINELNELSDSRRRVKELQNQLIEASKEAEEKKETVTRLIATKLM